MTEKVTDKVTDQEDSGEARIIESGDHKFDIDDPIQFGQLQGWVKGISQTVGRQGQELGELRKFKEVYATTDDEQELKREIQKAWEDEDPSKAFDLMLSHTKNLREADKKVLESERYNDRVWSDYLTKRPELLKHYDAEEVKVLSKSKFGKSLGEAKDVFSVLDSYWEPKLAKFGKGNIDEEGSTPIQVGSMGPGKAPSSKNPGEAPTKPEGKSFIDILDSVKKY